MPDDKRKRKVDAWFLALSQKYEVRDFIQDIKAAVPGATTEQVQDVLSSCVEEIQPSEGRARIKSCVLDKLRKTHPMRPDKDGRPCHPNRRHA